VGKSVPRALTALLKKHVYKRHMSNMEDGQHLGCATDIRIWISEYGLIIAVQYESCDAVDFLQLVMHANTGFDASWAYSIDDYNNMDYYSSQSYASDTDSTQDLGDLEELLYSHIHYEPNHLYVTGASDDHSYSDVQITPLRDAALDINFDIAASLTKHETSIASYISDDDELIIIDEILPQDEPSRSNSTATISLSSKQLKSKTASCKTSKLGDKVKTKSKKVDATSSASSISFVKSTAAKSLPINLLNDGRRSPSCKEVCGADGKHLADKKSKVKQKSGIISEAQRVKPVVADSDSESTSDAFCCDFSSDELSSDGVPDDIKLSNINIGFPQTFDIDALTAVLNSLPGMSSCMLRCSLTKLVNRYL